MIAKLRKKMVVFLYFSAGVFILFIFAQWGMRYTSTKKLTPIQKGIVGKVNGIPMSYQTYNNLVSNYLKNQNLDQQEAQDSAFKQLARNTLLQDIYKKRGLLPTDREIVEIIKISPPKEVFSDTLLWTDGKFDYNKYFDVLNNPQNIQWLTQYEKYIRAVIPMQRLSNDLMSTVRPTNIQILNQYMLENVKMRVEYGRIPISSAKILEDTTRIFRFYEKNKKSFRVGEKNIIKFVTFKIEPTVDDERVALENTKDILNMAKSEDVPFDTLIKNYSDDKAGWVEIKRGDRGKNFEKVAFSLHEGEISGVVKTDEGYEILKCIERRGNRVKLKHILIKIIPSSETEEEVLDRVREFIALSKKEGFEASASEWNLKVNETTNDKIGNIQLPESIKEKVVMRPLSSRSALYVWELWKKEPSHIPPFDEIKEEVRRRYVIEEQKRIAVEDVQSILTEIKTGEKFRKALTARGIKIRTTPYFTMKERPPGMPKTHKFYGACYQLKEGDVSVPIVGEKFVYLVQCIKRIEPKLDKEKDKLQQFQLTLFKKERERIFNEWLDHLIKNAKLEDYRYTY
jgi:parvulin-like peptidyl-prolyl isomerase